MIPFIYLSVHPSRLEKKEVVRAAVREAAVTARTRVSCSRNMESAVDYELAAKHEDEGAFESSRVSTSVSSPPPIDPSGVPKSSSALESNRRIGAREIVLVEFRVQSNQTIGASHSRSRHPKSPPFGGCARRASRVLDLFSHTMKKHTLPLARQLARHRSSFFARTATCRHEERGAVHVRASASFSRWMSR